MTTIFNEHGNGNRGVRRPVPLYFYFYNGEPGIWCIITPVSYFKNDLISVDIIYTNLIKMSNMFIQIYS